MDVDEEVDEIAVEVGVLAVVGSSGGSRRSPRLGTRALVVVVTGIEGVSTVVLVVVGRYAGVLVLPSASPKSSSKFPCRFLLGAPAAYQEIAAPDT